MTLMSGDYMDLRVSKIEPVTENVTSFGFAHPEGLDLPAFSPGSHVLLLLNVNGQVRRNSYTLTGDPDDRKHYQISVLRQSEGRGGSLFLHRALAIGDVVTVRRPMNFFAIDRMAKRHLLIAGGIGITPFLGFTHQLDRDGAPFELHYAARGDFAFAEGLTARYGDRVQCHATGGGQRLDIPALLARQPLGTHVYVCGPARMIEAVSATVEALGWPASCFHFERFRASADGPAFSVQIYGPQPRTLGVAPDQTMLEALEDAGVALDSMCRVGACGRCLVRVRAHAGRLLHRDHVLTAAEKAEGQAILPCVSRCEGRIEIEIQSARDQVKEMS